MHDNSRLIFPTSLRKRLDIRRASHGPVPTPNCSELEIRLQPILRSHPA